MSVSNTSSDNISNVSASLISSNLKGKTDELLKSASAIGLLPPRKRAKTAEEKEQRRVERILRNRRAAHASREKKRKHVEYLELYVNNLENGIKNYISNQEKLINFQSLLIAKLKVANVDISDIDLSTCTNIDIVSIEKPDGLDYSSNSSPKKNKKSSSDDEDDDDEDEDEEEDEDDNVELKHKSNSQKQQQQKEDKQVEKQVVEKQQQSTKQDEPKSNNKQQQKQVSTPKTEHKEQFSSPIMNMKFKNEVKLEDVNQLPQDQYLMSPPNTESPSKFTLDSSNINKEYTHIFVGDDLLFNNDLQLCSDNIKQEEIIVPNIENIISDNALDSMNDLNAYNRLHHPAVMVQRY
ncbi:hypothetical protein B5S32_g1275 [[Candida] boidinii]|nr:hypothetical protein B5S32_g1275 [[Candida] boidinii]